MRLSLLSLVASSPALLGAASSVDSEQVRIQDGDVRTLESWAYTDCGVPTDAIQLKSIEVSPDPPKPGEQLTVTVNAEVQEQIEEGAYADVVVKLGRIILLKKTFDICEEARKAEADVQCPVEKGPYTVVQTVDLPKEIPKAKFTVSVRGYTHEDDDMACVDLQVDFTSKPFFGFGW
ncbi:ML domain-containing protein [Schizophyllum commune]